MRFRSVRHNISHSGSAMYGHASLQHCLAASLKLCSVIQGAIKDAVLCPGAAPERYSLYLYSLTWGILASSVSDE